MEEWKTHFKEQFGGQEQVSCSHNTEEEDADEAEDITEEEVQYEIKNLKKKKAAGEDQIQNEMWIHTTENVVKKLTDILNRIWRGEGMPERWRKGVICPIHKKGDTNKVSNYRGITLLDTAYKIYASILGRRLQRQVEERNILPDTQAGFRKGRSTMDNIYILKHTIDQELQHKKGKVFVFFADLKAAFDNVNRKKLIETLKKLKINKRLINRINEIYKETKVVIEVNGKKTEEFWTTKGVRQGCPLSPTLFAIYIADLDRYLEVGQLGGVVLGRKKYWALAYADDLAVVAKTEAEMKYMLKRLRVYLKIKDLELNCEKSKIMIFRKGGGKESKEKWEWDGKVIEKMKEYKYLGFYLQRNNQPGAHIKELARKATVAMKAIWSIGEIKFGGDFRRRMMIFNYTVKSILLYGAEIWGWTEMEKIEKIQVKYIKWVLGLEKTTPTYIVLEEGKINKLRIEAGRRAMKFEEHINMRVDKELLYECQREQLNNEKNKAELTKRGKESSLIR